MYVLSDFGIYSVVSVPLIGEGISTKLSLLFRRNVLSLLSSRESPRLRLFSRHWVQ